MEIGNKIDKIFVARLVMEEWRLLMLSKAVLRVMCFVRFWE